MYQNKLAEWENLRSWSGRSESLRRCDHRLPDEGDAVPPRRGVLLPAGLAAVHKGNSLNTVTMTMKKGSVCPLYVMICPTW